MDFNFRKPLHIFALLLVLITLTFYIIYPIYLFITNQPVTSSEEVENLLDQIPFGEVYVLITELIFAFILLVLIPIIWYVVVNSASFKGALSKIKITLENIDIAFLWGIFAAILIYIIIFAISFVLQGLGADSSDLSNVTNLNFLSPPVLFVLVAVIPIAEEIFFRGFLLDKIKSFAGSNIAIIATSILFGIAHMGYGKIFPVIMPMIMGLLLAYIVIRTKNLFSAIIAHITFNVTVIIIYFLFSSLV